MSACGRPLIVPQYHRAVLRDNFIGEGNAWTRPTAGNSRMKSIRPVCARCGRFVAAQNNGISNPLRPHHLMSEHAILRHKNL